MNGQTSTGWVGLQFDSTGGALKHYGGLQLRITHTGANGEPGQIEAIQFAYNDVAGAGYTVGVVPEPGTASTLGALALGAVGLRSLRRKRREQETEADS